MAYINGGLSFDRVKYLERGMMVFHHSPLEVKKMKKLSTSFIRIKYDYRNVNK